MVRREPAGHQRVDHAAVFVLGQVHVVGASRDVAEECVLGRDVLTVAHERADVPVLERASVTRRHADPLRRDERDGPVDDGVDGGAAGSGDVHALMEREAAAPVHERVRRRRPVELHARVAEVRTDEMLPVEGLDGVAVALARDGLRGAGPARLGDLRACGERARECEHRACCDCDGGGEEELRHGRAEDAAPCAANWNVGVSSHAATVRPGPNRPVTARQRPANGACSRR